MSSFELSKYISYIFINNENTRSGKEPSPVKTTVLSGLARVIVVASLPTNSSRDVTLKIPIGEGNMVLKHFCFPIPMGVISGANRVPMGVFLLISGLVVKRKLLKI